MTLDLLKNENKIEIAEKKFFDLLSISSTKLSEKNVIYEFYDDSKLHFFHETSQIYHIKEINVEFSRIKKQDRIFYAFWLGKCDLNNLNLPILTLDFSLKPLDGNSLGVFADDIIGKIHILIRRNIGELRPNLYKNLPKQNQIYAFEGEKRHYFINLGKLKSSSNLLNNIKNFLQQLNKIKNDKMDNGNNISQNMNDISNSMKKPIHSNNYCLLCGKKILDADFTSGSPASLVKDQVTDKCVECLEKIFATKAINELKKYVLNIFNVNNLLDKVEDPNIFQSYIFILKKYGLLKEISEDVLILKNRKLLEDFINQYSVFTSIFDNSTKNSLIGSSRSVKVDISKEENSHKCKICGVELTKNNANIISSTGNLADKCKECSRKSHAARALKEINKFVEPETPFEKDDILKQVDNRIVFLDYIWTLQEFNLLEHDNKRDLFQLKSENEIDTFLNKYLDKKLSPTIPIKKTLTKEDKKVKVVKECEICGENLPISNFYKTSDDEYSSKCKECSRKSYAAKALVELIKCVDPGVIFFKKDLLDQCENRMKFLDYLWTMQEFDLLDFDEKSDSYKLKTETELNSFIKKFGDKSQIIESDSSKSPEESVTTFIKECKLCNKKLPVSKFYKSSTFEDGYSDQCKECKERGTVNKVLTEIEEFVTFGEPFKKSELLKNVDDETKVNYYIWTLQENDLISFNQKKDEYVIENNDKLKSFQYMTIKNKVDEKILSTSQDKNYIETSENETSINVDFSPENKEIMQNNNNEMLITTEQSNDADNLTSRRDEKKGKIIDTNEEYPEKLIQPLDDYWIKKEIIYISGNERSNYYNIMMKGIVKNNELISCLGELKSITSKIDKLLIHRGNGNNLDIMIDLEVGKESIDQILNALEDNNWKNLYNNK